MVRILFVCHGNICRSPMAEFIFRDKVEKVGLSDRVVTASAATSDEECWNGIGNPVYPAAREELRKRGLSCSGKRARQMTRADYAEYDLLLGMDRFNVRNMNRICGGDPDGKIQMLLDVEGKGEEIEDPWYSGRFERVSAQIERGCEAVLNELVIPMLNER